MRAGLKAYETERRPEAERIQHSANTSLFFFENVRRSGRPIPCSTTRADVAAKQVTYENLRKRDPQVIRDVDAWWTKHVASEASIRLPAGFRAPPPMFAPFTLRA